MTSSTQLSMVVRFCSAPSFITQNSMPIKKPVNKILRVTHSQISVNKTPPPRILSSSIRNKIFEDQSRGIVCYKDDTGEITCEGYDEGPRPEKSSYRPRDAEMVDHLLRNWVQLVEGSGKGFNLKGGFNRLC